MAARQTTNMKLLSIYMSLALACEWVLVGLDLVMSRLDADRCLTDLQRCYTAYLYAPSDLQVVGLKHFC